MEMRARTLMERKQDGKTKKHVNAPYTMISSHSTATTTSATCATVLVLQSSMNFGVAKIRSSSEEAGSNSSIVASSSPTVAESSIAIDAEIHVRRSVGCRIETSSTGRSLGTAMVRVSLSRCWTTTS